MSRRKLIIISIVAIAFISSVGYVAALNGYFGGGGTIPADTFTRGLVGYWSFDEGAGQTAADASGSGNNGTLTNGPEWTTPSVTAGEPGPSGSALDFDGVDASVVVSDASSTQNIFDSGGSVSGWIYPRSDGEASLGWAFGKGWNLRMQSESSGNVVIRFSQPFDVTAGAWTTAADIPLNQWTHVVIVYDNSSISSEPTIYVNALARTVGSGLTVGSTPDGTRTSDVGTDFTIGNKSNNARTFDGSIDEVRIYNRALSAAEIKFMYNRGAPVGHWRFDEGAGSTAFDSAGSNDGTLTNMATTTAWVQGKFGTALDFDGSNDFVEVPDSSELGVTSAFTISMWLYDKSSTNDRQLEKGDSYFILDNFTGNGCTTTGRWQFLVKNSDVVDCVEDTVTHAQNQWYHVVGVKDSSNIFIYVDGVFKASNSNTTAIDDDNLPLRIGSDDAGTFFDGRIDDVRIYNYARTAEEIRLDYNAGLATRFGGSPSQDVTRGLVGHWDFNEGAGTVANDSTDNSNDGTLTNSPRWANVSRTLPADSFGVGGNALDFDGVDDYVTTTDITLVRDMTVSEWFYTKSTTRQAIVAKFVGTFDGTFYTEYNNGSIGFTTVNDSSTRVNLTASVGDLRNEWHFISATYDGTNMRIYLDGVEQNSASQSGNLLDIGESLAMGIWSTSNKSSHFTGLIDEVRIYNRALSAAEIRYLYNKGGPVSHWKFDEGSGTTAFDSQGSNDGTLTNMSTTTAWVLGKYGTALDFDGVDDEVNFGDVLDLDGNSLSISLWHKPDTVPSASDVLISKKALFDATEAGFWIEIRNDRTMFRVSDGTNHISPNGNAPIQGVWEHVVVTYDASTKKGIVYQNGVQTAIQTNASIGNVSNAVNLLVGDQGNGGRDYDGKIDDVRIYNYVRTTEQIRVDYNAGLAAKFGGSPNQDINRGLVGHWNFDEGAGQTANDSSDSSNNGTLGASSSESIDDPRRITVTDAPSGVSGLGGGALDFDGADDFVDLPDLSSLVESTDKMTVTLWAKVDGFTGGDDPSFIESNSGGNFAVGLDGDDEQQYRFRLQTTNGTVTCPSTASGNPAITANTWTYIAAVYDGSTMKIYEDTVEKVSCSQTGNISLSSSGNWHIGARPGQSFIDGQIDEVRIYNRVLSAAEIRYLYNKGKPVAHWKFDEGSGSTAFDSQGSNDGTLINMATTTAWVQGKYGTALDFDGSNDYVDVGNSDIFDSSVITISTWVNWNGGGDNNARVISKGSDGGPGSFALLKDQFLGFDNSMVFRVNGATIDDTVTIPQNIWTHYTATVDSIGNARLYRNGLVVGGPTAVTLNDNNLNLLIGDKTGAAGLDNWGGQIDDVRIYNYARSPSEILQDYNAGLSTHFK